MTMAPTAEIRQSRPPKTMKEVRAQFLSLSRATLLTIPKTPKPMRKIDSTRRIVTGDTGGLG